MMGLLTPGAGCDTLLCKQLAGWDSEYGSRTGSSAQHVPRTPYRPYRRWVIFYRTPFSSLPSHPHSHGHTQATLMITQFSRQKYCVMQLIRYNYSILINHHKQFKDKASSMKTKQIYMFVIWKVQGPPFIFPPIGFRRVLEYWAFFFNLELFSIPSHCLRHYFVCSRFSKSRIIKCF